MPSPDGQRLNVFDQGDIADSQTPADVDQSTTPPRPSYSPVTPTMTHASLNVASNPLSDSNVSEPQWMDEPEAIPLSLDENTDAIALQATLGVLQLQKQQSVRDIRILKKARDAALEHPEVFLEDLKAGKLTKPPQPPVVAITSDNDSDSDAHSADNNDSVATRPDFGPLPEMQDVVRCPPINWAKYHVVGESLDKLHEEQRRRPDPGEPRTDDRPPEHAISAPYNHFTDKVELPPPMQTRSGSKSVK